LVLAYGTLAVVSSLPIDPGDPIWEDPRSAAERWRDDWAERARRHPRAARQGFVLTRAQCALSTAEIRSRLRRRILWAARPGVYSVVHPGVDAKVVAALRATGAAAINPGSVISHESAAVLLGVRVLEVPSQPLLTSSADCRGGQRNGVLIRRARIDAPARWYGMALTSAARTVVDIARVDRDAGLVTADDALAEGLVTRTELLAAVAECAGWPGNAAAAWVAQHADRGSESALESLTRACIITAGLPAPALQVWIGGDRVDMVYEAERVVIEVDGMLKYDGDPRALRREKLRQERIERAGYRVVRVTWADVIHHPAETIARIRNALITYRPR
jgi:very-short-patch-repair endonuclease